jgi:hypothetical protein
VTLLKLLLAVLGTKRRTPSASLCCQARRVAVSRPHCDRIAVRWLNLTSRALLCPSYAFRWCPLVNAMAVGGVR